MVNCNPETVSTDYDTSDRLYFEPLTFEDVMNIVEREQPRGRDRAVRRPDPAQAGGAARARGRADPGHAARRDRPRGGPPPLLGSPRPARPRAGARLHRALLRGGRRGSPTNIGYPVLVRPSYVLGGRAMQIVYDEADLQNYMKEAVRVSPEHPDPGGQVPRGRPRDRRGRHRGRPAGGGGRGHGARGEGGRALGRLRVRAAALLAGRRPDRAHPGARRARSRRSWASSACSTSSSRSRTSRSSSSRSIRAPPGRCRSCRRRSGCRWPSSPPG